MKYIPFFLMLVSTTIFIVISGCDSSSQETQSRVTGAETPEPLWSAASSESSSSEFTIEATSTDNDVDLDTEHTSNEERLSIDIFTADPLDLTSTLQISTPSVSPSSDDMTANVEHNAYLNMPQNITYNGYSTVNHNHNGTSYSKSLNSDEQNVMDELDQALSELTNYIISQPHQKRFATTKGAGVFDVHAMSDNDVKQWLKEKGYNVKKLGDRHFQVIRKYKKGQKMSITSVFNANTGKMEPGYTASKNGNVISEHFSKSNNNAHKSKIKRENGNYVLLNIKQKNNCGYSHEDLFLNVYFFTWMGSNWQLSDR